jgi:hypothetical protein
LRFPLSNDERISKKSCTVKKYQGKYKKQR